MKDGTVEVVAETPVAVATFLLNEKRKPLSEIQERHDIRLSVIPNQNLDTPHYEITRLKEDEAEDLPKTYNRVTQQGALTCAPPFCFPSEPNIVVTIIPYLFDYRI